MRWLEKDGGWISGAELEDAPLLSVIVAVYNIEAYIGRCVRSLMAQTYPALEILLVDDGSTDQSGSICDDLAKEDGRIRVLHKENGGLSDARNAGISWMRGELVAFVDGDDWVEPWMYERLYYWMRRTDSPIAVCAYEQIYSDRRVDASTGGVVLLEGREALEVFLAERDDIPIRNCAWNKLYKRELMGELRFPVGKQYEDIVYTTRLLAGASRLVYVDCAAYHYEVQREGSIMGQGLNERIFTDQIPLYEEKEAFLRRLGREDLADQHRYFYYKRLVVYYNRCIRSKDPDQKRYAARVRGILLAGRDEMDRIYGYPWAGRNERIKTMLLVRSEPAYRVFLWVNEKLLLPPKRGRAGRLV